jgi:hypothetical protein
MTDTNEAVQQAVRFLKSHIICESRVIVGAFLTNIRHPHYLLNPTIYHIMGFDYDPVEMGECGLDCLHISVSTLSRLCIRTDYRRIVYNIFSQFEDFCCDYYPNVHEHEDSEGVLREKIQFICNGVEAYFLGLVLEWWTAHYIYKSEDVRVGYFNTILDTLLTDMVLRFSKPEPLTIAYIPAFCETLLMLFESYCEGYFSGEITSWGGGWTFCKT